MIRIITDGIFGGALEVLPNMAMGRLLSVLGAMAAAAIDLLDTGITHTHSKSLGSIALRQKSQRRVS